jgi:hypothetical protein
MTCELTLPPEWTVLNIDDHVTQLESLSIFPTHPLAHFSSALEILQILFSCCLH